MTINGQCPTCELVWRDYEPGDTLRCPKCETRVTLVTLVMPPDRDE